MNGELNIERESGLRKPGGRLSSKKEQPGQRHGVGQIMLCLRPEQRALRGGTGGEGDIGMQRLELQHWICLSALLA